MNKLRLKKYILIFSLCVIVGLVFIFNRIFLTKNPASNEVVYVSAAELKTIISTHQVDAICRETGSLLSGEKIDRYSIEYSNKSIAKISLEQFDSCGETCKNFLKSMKYQCGSIIN